MLCEILQKNEDCFQSSIFVCLDASCILLPHPKESESVAFSTWMYVAEASVVLFMQAVLCNDCGKRGQADFHFVYHKCPHCDSYNTRLV